MGQDVGLNLRYSMGPGKQLLKEINVSRLFNSPFVKIVFQIVYDLILRAYQLQNHHWQIDGQVVGCREGVVNHS